VQGWTFELAFDLVSRSFLESESVEEYGQEPVSWVQVAELVSAMKVMWDVIM
jgi:hypothetical protein